MRSLEKAPLLVAPASRKQPETSSMATSAQRSARVRSVSVLRYSLLLYFIIHFVKHWAHATPASKFEVDLKSVLDLLARPFSGVLAFSIGLNAYLWRKTRKTQHFSEWLVVRDCYRKAFVLILLQVMFNVAFEKFPVEMFRADSLSFCGVIFLALPFIWRLRREFYVCMLLVVMFASFHGVDRTPQLEGRWFYKGEEYVQAGINDIDPETYFSGKGECRKEVRACARHDHECHEWLLCLDHCVTRTVVFPGSDRPCAWQCQELVYHRPQLKQPVFPPPSLTTSELSERRANSISLLRRALVETRQGNRRKAKALLQQYRKQKKHLERSKQTTHTRPNAAQPRPKTSLWTRTRKAVSNWLARKQQMPTPRLSGSDATLTQMLKCGEKYDCSVEDNTVPCLLNNCQAVTSTCQDEALCGEWLQCTEHCQALEVAFADTIRRSCAAACRLSVYTDDSAPRSVVVRKHGRAGDNPSYGALMNCAAQQNCTLDESHSNDLFYRDFGVDMVLPTCVRSRCPELSDQCMAASHPAGCRAYLECLSDAEFSTTVLYNSETGQPLDMRSPNARLLVDDMRELTEATTDKHSIVMVRGEEAGRSADNDDDDDDDDDDNGSGGDNDDDDDGDIDDGEKDSSDDDRGAGEDRRHKKHSKSARKRPSSAGATSSRPGRQSASHASPNRQQPTHSQHSQAQRKRSAQKPKSSQRKLLSTAPPPPPVEHSPQLAAAKEGAAANDLPLPRVHIFEEKFVQSNGRCFASAFLLDRASASSDIFFLSVKHCLVGEGVAADELFTNKSLYFFKPDLFVTELFYEGHFPIFPLAVFPLLGFVVGAYLYRDQSQSSDPTLLTSVASRHRRAIIAALAVLTSAVLIVQLVRDIRIANEEDRLEGLDTQPLDVMAFLQDEFRNQPFPTWPFLLLCMVYVLVLLALVSDDSAHVSKFEQLLDTCNHSPLTVFFVSNALAVWPLRAWTAITVGAFTLPDTPPLNVYQAFLLACCLASASLFAMHRTWHRTPSSQESRIRGVLDNAFIHLTGFKEPGKHL